MNPVNEVNNSFQIGKSVTPNLNRRLQLVLQIMIVILWSLKLM